MPAVIEKYTKVGVNMVGIGIKSEAVKEFYPEYVVLNDVTDLPGQVMNTIKKIILGKINKS